MFNKLLPITSKYKFRALKTYVDITWLFENRRNYRAVFDRYETDYIYSELSFYNKLFDVKDWSAQIKLKCFLQTNERKAKLICELSFNKVIRSEQPIFYIEEGWGSINKGAFWTAGTYCWVAYIDGKEVGDTFFHVTESKETEFVPAAYLSFDSLNMYEGKDGETRGSDQNLYLFDHAKTRYIHQLLILKNKLPHKLWFCEIVARHYTKKRQLISNQSLIVSANQGTETLEVYFGWGSSDPGSWTVGSYTVEYLFLDTVIAVAHYEVGTEAKEGPNELMVTPEFQSKSEGANVVDTAAERLKIQKVNWISKIAKSQIESVIDELLSHLYAEGDEEKLKVLVNLSAHWTKTIQQTDKEVEQAAFNETLIDFIHTL